MAEKIGPVEWIMKVDGQSTQDQKSLAIKYSVFSSNLFCPSHDILQELPDFTQTIPWVEPSLEKVDYDKLARELPFAYNKRLPPAAREWWENFINELPKNYQEVRFSFVNKYFLKIKM